MLKTRVIPCLDVKDGRVVKGVNFVDLVDAGDPVEAAKAYDRAGADELCFLDITASSDDRGILLDVVRRTAEHCFMPVSGINRRMTRASKASARSWSQVTDCRACPVRPASFARRSRPSREMTTKLKQPHHHGRSSAAPTRCS